MLRNKLILLTAAGMVAVTLPAFAQHEHHQEPAKDTVSHENHDMKSMGQGTHMTHSFSLSLPMTRNGSGTGWQPDATPMYAYMKHGKMELHAARKHFPPLYRAKLQ
jgi:hypothetical protein